MEGSAPSLGFHSPLFAIHPSSFMINFLSKLCLFIWCFFASIILCLKYRFSSSLCQSPLLSTASQASTRTGSGGTRCCLTLYISNPSFNQFCKIRFSSDLGDSSFVPQSTAQINFLMSRHNPDKLSFYLKTADVADQMIAITVENILTNAFCYGWSTDFSS